MRDIYKKVAGVELFLFGHLRHSENRGNANPPRLSGAPQVFYVPLLCPLFKIDFERVVVSRAIQLILENFPACPLRIAHQLDKSLPLIFFHIEDENESVLTL